MSSQDVAPTREHVSASFLDTLQKCGVRAKFRYVDGIIVPPGVAMVRGDGVHEAVAKNMRAKRDNGALLPIEELTDTVSDAIDLKVADGLMMTEEEEQLGLKRVIGETKDIAVELVRIHSKDLAPTLQPDMVEAEIMSVHPIEQLGGKKLMARLDLVEVDGTVRDTKTTTKSKSAREAEASQQLSTYAFAYYLAKGQLPRATHLDVLVSLKKGAKVQVLESVRDWPQVNATLDAMGRAQKIFDAGVFLPTDPGNWWCLSMDTEVLTSDGTRAAWKTFQQLGEEDQVLTINQQSMNLEWQRYSNAFVKTHKSRRMVSYVGKGVRFCVTPEHDMLVRSMGRGRWRWTKASSIESRGSIAYPVAAHLERHSAIELSDDWIALSGWICAEGSFRDDGAINLYQNKTSPHYKTIYDLLNRIGLGFSVSGEECAAFYIKKPSSVAVRKKLQENKSIPRWLWDADGRQFRVWLKAFSDGDGHRKGNTIVIGQKDESFIDDLQALALTHRMSTSKDPKRKTSTTGGQYSTISIIDGITERIPESAQAEKHFIEADAKEVWCMSTPNETLVTRYMGRVLITGNCSKKWCGYASQCPFYVKEADKSE